MLKNKNNRRIKIIAIILLVLIAVGVSAYFILDNDDKPAVSTANSSDNINYSPPTETDKTNVEQNKERIISNEQNVNAQPQTSGKKAVKPVITYAGQYDAQVEVGAYVSAFEDGGDCTAKFTNGNKSISKTVKAVKNVSSVNCPAMIAKNDELSPKGNWVVIVSYDSPAASGSSDSKTVEVK